MQYEPKGVMMSNPSQKLRYLSAILPLILMGHSQGNAMAANCAPVEVSWGSADECKVLSTEVKDGESKVLISPPRREANKFVGVGSATFKCEVGTLTYVSGSCGNMVDSYSSQRVSTLPTAQTAPTVASSTELSPVRSTNTLKSAQVTQLTNEVGSWESQMSKDMKAQEARMVAYTDTKHSQATSYTDTKATETLASANSFTNTKAAETLASANSFTNTKSAETLASANSYANTRANQALASANSYTDTKSSQTLASANSYTDSKATATLNSANSYTNSKSTETLNSANSYTNTQSTQTLNSANAYTDSKATATLNSANTYTNNSSATTLANSKTYTDSKSASTLTAANNYTDQEIASVSQQGSTGTDAGAKPWSTYFKGQCKGTYCIRSDGAIPMYNQYGGISSYIFPNDGEKVNYLTKLQNGDGGTNTYCYAHPISGSTGYTGWNAYCSSVSNGM
jgi:hypothetical protein